MSFETNISPRLVLCMNDIERVGSGVPVCLGLVWGGVISSKFLYCGCSCVVVELCECS